MGTTIKSIFAGLFLASTIFLPETILAQKSIPGEQLEKTLSFWSLTMEQVRIQVGATKQEYGIFNRFSSHPIDSLHIDFLNKVNDNKIDQSNAEKYLAGKKTFIVNLFHNFQKAEQEYPSSVNEYSTLHPLRVNGDSCFTTCYNTNFGDGTLDGWYGYYAVNASPDNNTGPFNITTITGGYCGAVSKAGGPDPYTGNDYQIRVTSGAANDPFLLAHSSYSMPEVSPYASGGHCVMLGDSNRNGAGVAILSQTFLVSPSTTSLTYQYALLLENPGGHLYYAQPFFSVAVLDQHGDTIPTCGQYSVSAQNAQANGFKGVWYPAEADSVYWKNWTLVNVPLKHYIGQCVTIVFQVIDCSLGGHFGYAYIDAGCSPGEVLASSPNFCGQDSITLTGPPGESKYLWRGPINKPYSHNGIRNHDSTTQTVSIDSSGIYRLIIVPVTGAACADTLYDTIGISHHPHPKPGFTADTVCLGQPTRFINTSLPHDSGVFSWDFYNLGIYDYNDLNYKDTLWTYPTPGVFTVKLHELLDGCGFDTLIKVKVDTAVGPPTFTALPLCTGDSTFFTPTAAHASKYDWHFGDPASGIHDSSKRANPGHMFTHAGTFMVTLKAINTGNCDAIDSFPVTVLATPRPVISGPDSVCVGGNITLTVTGGTTYQWFPGGSTNNFLNITGTVTETVTVAAINGGCSHDTTFKVTVVPAVSASIRTSKDSVCKGDSLTLYGASGLKYKWSPGGQTSSTVHVNQNVTTTYTLYTYSGSCKDSTTVTIPVIALLSGTARTNVDSICPGQSAILTVTSAGGGSVPTYSWSPGGGNSSSITVSPNTTTIYTVTITTACGSMQIPVPITVVPYPKPLITGTTWKCKGVRDTLYVSNSNGPATYVWSNGKTTTSITTGFIDADSTITVTAYNKLGCPHDTTYNITLRLPLDITVPPPAIFCAGQKVCISATVTGTPQSPISYSWSDGETTSTICVSPDSATTFIVTVSNGCKSSKATLLTPNTPNLYGCCNQTLSMVNDTTTPLDAILYAQGNSIKYQWLDSNNVVCLDPPLCDSVKVNPKTTTTYTVIGTDANGCTISQLITVTVDIPCFNLTIPNVFTPTNAGIFGLDNIFYIKTNNIDGWSISIYDRWGKQMFSTTDQYKYWNGKTESGGDAPAGVYYYIITGTCQNTTYKKDGFLQLIR